MAYQLHRSAPGTSRSSSHSKRAAKMRTCAASSSSVLRSIQQSVASKQQSAVEVTTAYLQQLKSVEGQVNAFLTVDEQAALSQVCAVTHNCIAASAGAAILVVPGLGCVLMLCCALHCYRLQLLMLRLLVGRQWDRWRVCLLPSRCASTCLPRSSPTHHPTCATGTTAVMVVTCSMYRAPCNCSAIANPMSTHAKR